ncbi:MAG: hypothetical protein QXV83_04250 [Candidatus Anstonellaceae archaeon]
MKIFYDGISMAREITKKYSGEKNLDLIINKLEKVFENNFIETKLTKSNFFNRELFFEKYSSALKLCKEEFSIDPKITAMWFNIFLEKYENKLWLNCAKGQRAELFVATNSSSINPSIIFNNGSRVMDGVLYGNFGISIDVKDAEDIKHTNDFVPNSYMITHDNLPKAIIFLSVIDSIKDLNTQQCINCSNYHKIRTSSISCSNPVGLTYLRAKKYVEDVRDAKHYADLDAYRHVTTKDSKEVFYKIPIFLAVYNKEDDTIYSVDKNCKISYKLREILPKGDKFFNDLERALVKLEKSGYSNLLQPSLLKQIGCVDARIRNILIPVGYIKEIGSVLNSYQIKSLLESNIDGIISSSHTNCGYISTLYSVHLANKELREVFGDKNPILRKILEASYSKLLNGKIGVFFGHAEVKAAINEAELEGFFISNNTKKFLLDFISFPSHDVRKTIRHALFRNKVTLDEEGYLVLNAAKNLEERINHLPFKLDRFKIDFLLNEESARENLNAILSTLKKEGLTNQDSLLGAYIFDLNLGYKLAIEPSLPTKEEDFYFISRRLFFEPNKQIVL